MCSTPPHAHPPAPTHTLIPPPAPLAPARPRPPPPPQVVVPLPDAAGRAQILAVHLRATPLEEELQPQQACLVRACVLCVGPRGRVCMCVCGDVWACVCVRGREGVRRGGRGVVLTMVGWGGGCVQGPPVKQVERVPPPPPRQARAGPRSSCGDSRGSGSGCACPAPAWPLQPLPHRRPPPQPLRPSLPPSLTSPGCCLRHRGLQRRGAGQCGERGHPAGGERRQGRGEAGRLWGRGEGRGGARACWRGRRGTALGGAALGDAAVAAAAADARCRRCYCFCRLLLPLLMPAAATAAAAAAGEPARPAAGRTAHPLRSRRPQR